MTQPVIIYTFAGREANMRLLRPYMERILAENPDTQWDIWNLCRDSSDVKYLQTISGDRITVRNDFYNPARWYEGLSDVWRHYADESYRGTTFVKTDDDTPFVQTDRFGEFMDVVRAFPNHIVSAAVVNNGAGTRFFPGIQAGFEELGIPLLDVHMSNEYAEMAHQWFLENLQDALDGPVEAVDVETWVSINWIAGDWSIMKRIADLVGKPSPPRIADRDWPAGSIIGDEGAANMLPRIVVRGFVVSHLGFGPQRLSKSQEGAVRARYEALL